VEFDLTPDTIAGFSIYVPSRINWVSKDPGAPAGSDNAYGVKRKFYKYQIKGQSTWTTVELSYSSNINDPKGKYQQWSWFYPGKVLPINWYYIKLIAEDNAGIRRESPQYQIRVTDDPPI
jgi:hypothetical protein